MSREKVIGSFSFPTRKAAEAAIREILHVAELKQPLVGNERDLIEGLVYCHPTASEKIGAGIESIDVRVIEHGARGFWITRVDGTAVDFSYRKALDGAPNYRQTVLSALRREVKDQVNEFRRAWFAENDDPRCSLTGQVLTMGPEAHVDHWDPSFAELANDFVSALGGWDQIPIKPAGVGQELADENHRVIWLYVHQQRARLRVIHRSANLARNRRAATQSINPAEGINA